MRIVPENRRPNDVGDVFGRLTIIGTPFYAKWTESISCAVCRCECGAFCAVRLNALRTGVTVSCGCQQRDSARELASRRPKHIVACATCGKEFRSSPSDNQIYCSRPCVPANVGTHGMSKTRLHGIWCQMKTRCTCPTRPQWEYYGGRGISVCQEWSDSFESFRDWALANGYEESLEIDRKDVNGNYCPDNCRWATRSQQMANTRKPKNGTTSKYKGVSWSKEKRGWVAQIRKGHSYLNLGRFASEVDAAIAYNAAASELFGEFANLNQI